MKLVIIANRIPLTIRGTDPLIFVRSPGGLVSGIDAFIKKANISDWVWIGWVGSRVKKRDLEKIRSTLIQESNCIPIYIPEKLLDKFYNGFSNKTLWPLFHNMPDLATYKQDEWQSYQEVNKLFFRALIDNVEVDKDTYIWIHDYHLMLLPSMVREFYPDAKIGFFLHIPFPPPETFAQLPWKRETLEGLLGADVIGFHTYEYTTNFLRSLSRVLGIEHSMGELVYNSRIIKADTFPMGIDVDKFNVKDDEIEEQVLSIKQVLHYKKIIFSVDRLDYTKGIYNRLLAYEDLLKRREDFRNNVVLILNIVPSREGVEHYQRMKRQIEEKIAEINGYFGSVEWVPILYHYKSLPVNELIAHYRACDVILITPIKDGMNLVAKEFVASRQDLKGVLILSEFAGAAKELGEALIVNPNSIEELSKAIEAALDMPEDEQSFRLKAMQERLRRYDILRWGNDFISSVKEISSKREILKTKELTERLIRKLKDMFNSARKRLILLDYDGTLIPIARRPDMAIPTEEIRYILYNLGSMENTKVVLISGRKKEWLERWFGNLPITLVAEHGCLIKSPGESWEAKCYINQEIREKVKNIMESYVDKLPQAFVEEKDFTLAFHYRNADQEMASLRVAELVDEISSLIANTELNILMGNKVVEIRPASVNKGTIAVSLSQDCDFILAMGDDTTDEDMFKSLPQKSITIKVGTGPSFARYYLPSQRSALDFLSKLSKS
ncbi:bifunctional alpha,alpha-trehalose-phosphate synthase (UDP-forming)/trehalose-phosphatase [Hydrogenobacter hydrogenophilus]|uniref:Trehalose 6-phosphate synthase/phosphatase n=1 Tax=Hydrogenobacter hydrogenophilus TaxID=35835 RepID=A0A285NQS7_9AQUI|nr:bifunctional alpha,alpha-trehalose-phosphate synthase (UDP-forming)/trehalose-phosphatase [Hydrogenobacter hydrogenophilus]SNZ11874.1 trehalose 6-phosphate synthase/phosphatase [Hydrogenobacter hydrogenophilus]